MKTAGNKVAETARRAAQNQFSHYREVMSTFQAKNAGSDQKRAQQSGKSGVKPK